MFDLYNAILVEGTQVGTLFLTTSGVAKVGKGGGALSSLYN